MPRGPFGQAVCNTGRFDGKICQNWRQGCMGWTDLQPDRPHVINWMDAHLWSMAQMPALIPKEVEIQRLKKIWLIVIAMGSTAASVEVDNFVDGSLHQTSIRDSAFTPAHWWLYSHFVALPLGWGAVAIYDRRVPILRGPNNSMNTGLKMTILGYLATMFTIGVNEMWHFWFVEEIFAVPNHWMFNMGVVVAFMGALAYVVRVYARLVELGAETPGENPYVAEMYKMALEGKLYSRSIP